MTRLKFVVPVLCGLMLAAPVLAGPMKLGQEGLLLYGLGDHFTFVEASPGADGQRRLSGSTADRSATLDLTGPANRLSAATLSYAAPDADLEWPLAGAHRDLGKHFTGNVFPRWKYASEWIHEALNKARQQGKVVQERDGHVLTITYAADSGRFTLTATGK